jgi:hypothetical protein
MISDMKLNIRNKLFLAFAAILVLTGVVGVFAVNTLGTVDRNSSEMYSNQFKALYYAEEANKDLIYMGRQIRQAVIFIDDPATVQKQMAEVTAYQADITKQTPLPH